MLVYLIERDKDKFKYLEQYFSNLNDVILINDEFKSFMSKNKVQCIVSPANSFGIMDGGYDEAITEWYGEKLQNDVQNYIIENFYGEQPVGSSFIIKTNKYNQFLIHTPTMRTPEKIKDSRIVYHCMRSTLIMAKKNNIKSILIPMFGGATGEINPKTIAQMMRLAYNQFLDVPTMIDWDYAKKYELDLLDYL